ncbi:ABC transporter permease [Mucilaginibacter sp. L3T2-6]|uniref:ABC transporter permease n=1 Tax=Mucilaginibacter sp. L3T2-6 TaxID=3062491 RepID=UPI00267730CC|nr:ABC transporter permease [Mucilaginibacter sp. L3T2-6]MDO3641147.1 ABC transporter permease [Mucilaginibacter sp. L3T2-6]MDV6213377.1 FtsX-like permease family protein [Mucilaginibacter sp. L3T2-6]
MIKSYLKIAWRNLIRHKIFSLINIGGLSTGIAACLLISLYVHYQLSFDAANSKKDRILRITNLMHTPEKDNINMALSPELLATTLRQNYPEVQTAVRFAPTKGVIKLNGQVFKQDDVYTADANVFDVFDYKFAEGSAADALTDLHGLTLTKSTAIKYFGNGSALNKTMVCNGKPYRVAAVLEDLPENCDLEFTILLPVEFYKTTSWLEDDFSVYTYVLFKQKPDIAAFKRKLAGFSSKTIQLELNKIGATKYSMEFNAEPLSDVHFSSGKLGDTPKGDKQLVYIFSILAVVILVVALLNYINLSTARAAERAKEVGVRKVNGALRGSLISQSLFESFCVTLIALVIAIGLSLALLPLLNNLLQIKLSFFASGRTIIFICGLVLTSSLLTGLYPAFVLSAFKPVTALKANFNYMAKGLTLRKIITVTQFVVATVMIAGAFIMNEQINFVQHRSIGYDKDQLLTVSLPDDSVALLHVPAFNNALNQMSQVKGTSVQNGLAVDNGGQAKSTTLTIADGRKRELMSNYFSIDEKFIPLLKMRLLAGRNFSEQMITDKQEGFIVNEAFVKQLGWKHAIGQPMEGMNHKGRVVGVVKNFHYESMHNPVAPLVMIYTGRGFRPGAVLVKVSPKDLTLIKTAWQSYFPDYPFNYEFMDAAFNAVYQKDVTTIRLFNYFTVLSIALACLGLYGLAHLIAIQRTKEIGIRKVLGAALSQLMVLLAKDFIKLVAIAAMIAIPVTLIIMNKWLTSYAYHISVNWWLLASPVFAILLIALLVISYQTIKVAATNPVKSLKSE